MAEVFGLAVGVFGVGSLAIQLVDSAKKLKELSRSYGGANEEVDSLVTELEILGRLESRFSQTESSEAADVIGMNWARLDLARLSLRTVVEGVQAKLTAKPRRGKIQYLFNESTITAWLEKLSRAKTDLTLALQLIHGETISREISELRTILQQSAHDQDAINQKLDDFNLQMRRFGEIFVRQGDILSTLTTKDHDGLMVQRVSKLYFWPFSFTYEIGTYVRNLRTQVETRHRVMKEEVCFRLYLPRWFVRQQWAICGLRATSGWRFKFRIYNILPDESPIFDLVVSGELEAVKSAFSARQACIYDENQCGLTLLHIAAFAHQLEVASFLLDEGADTERLSAANQSPLDEMLYVMPSKIPSIKTSLQLFSLLRAHDETDAISNDRSQNARLLVQHGTWDDKDRLLFILMLHQPAAVVHVNLEAQDYEIKSAEALSQDLDDLEDRVAAFCLVADKEGLCTVLHLTASRYLQVGMSEPTTSSSLSTPSSLQLGGWRKLCTEAIQSGASLTCSASYYEWQTPLGLALRRVLNSLAWHGVDWERSKRVLDACLQAWLDLLRDNNVQLSLYYVEEWKQFEYAHGHASAAAESPHWSWWMSSVSSFCIVTKKFLYKASIETESWRFEERFHGQRPDSKGWQDRVTELHNSDLAYLSIPGAWDTPQCQAWWGSDERTGQPEPGPDTINDNASNLLALMHNCHGRGWLSTYQIPGTSREAESFRKLRLGLEGYADPLKVDFGHGKSCRCQVCHHKRQPIVERRALENTRIRRTYELSHYGGGGGFSGWSRGVAPRDSGHG